MIPRTLLAWLLLVTVCLADPPPAHLPTQAVCRVEAGPGVNGNGGTSCGSGVLIDATANKDGLVVTNNHVVADGGPYRVTFPDGKTHGALLLGRDAQLDLAALKIQQVHRHPARWTDKIAGERFYSAGFGGNARLRCKWGNHTGGNRNHPRRDAYFSMPIIGGDSGGPVFDQRGYVCGVCWGGEGTDGRLRGYYDDTVAVHPQCLAQFLAQWNIKPSPVEQQCWGGGCQPYYVQPYQQPSQPAQPDGGFYTPDPTPEQPIADNEPEADADGWRAVIEDRIATLEQRAPVPGPTGPQGERGEPGEKGETGAAGRDGKDGQDAVVDYDKLAGEVIKRLPPIHVEQQDYYTGKVLDTGEVRLGGVLVLRYGVEGEQHARPQ